jgi:diguanylate cyclase (GGDEF)-like protein
VIALAKRALLALLLLVALPAQAAQELVLGVFAFRPKPVMIERYQPLADYLSTKLGGVRVRLEVLEQSELEEAVATHRIDLVMTNPTHYLLLRVHSSLSGALATVISAQDGSMVSTLGGVIITRAERTDLVRLQDLRGRRIAISGPRFMGGYQAQVFELIQAGVRVPEDVDFLEVGRHDAVVEAVLEGRADVGFVRTGILESLAAEGRLDPARLQVIHRQRLAGYPYAVSTRLYPEWPFVALPHVEGAMVRRISAALLSLEASHPAARAAYIGGFSPPLDYLPVETLARTLRLPPFDAAPPFLWRDVWSRYAAFIVALGVAAGLVVVLFLMVARRNRQLAQSVAALVEAQDTLHHIAYHDALTGLPNRALLADRLRQDMRRARRDGHRIAVAYIDLDGFKAANDTYGHAVGDRLLVEVAGRLREVLRDGDTVARLGGDEFVAVLSGVEPRHHGVAVIERLLAAIAEPVSIDGRTLQVSGSVGVSYFPQDGEIEADQLLRQADHAMYDAKTAGRNCYRIFRPDEAAFDEGVATRREYV